MRRGGGVKQHEEPRSSYARLCERIEPLCGSGLLAIGLFASLAQMLC